MGSRNPLIGFVVAFVAALLAVKWLVSYLQRHGHRDLRLVPNRHRAYLAIVLLATGVM